MKLNIKASNKQCILLIPIKSPDRAKSRMTESLSSESIQKLVKAMLVDVLTVVTSIKEFYPVVIAPNDSYRSIVQDFSVDYFQDSGLGYNECIKEFMHNYALNKSTKLLIVPADQPRIKPDILNNIMQFMNSNQIVQVRAQDGGTGALGLNPFDIMPTLFGIESSTLHHDYAIKNNLRIHEIYDSCLSYDVDKFSDLTLSVEHSFGNKTQLIIDEIIEYNNK
ncbi:MAG: 2-phospho-L-lactate guanylyltransferase [Dehalococcoidia bacterium]|jgi:2-phospho-L-lactate guanylyltransferase|nr:MAG: 2-phospho-L-lactate guanylyltransferase, coenzyme F420 biosynthesis enzyme, CobY/MobA/RfbA family [Chloroflexota bacterium]|tara:strand:- start:13435 stop:14100 length:666 start_codon:yes stop_codon:yes gene_type:complete